MKAVINNQRGNVMILVLIIAGVMGVTLSTLTVYSVNQANYINRVREAYQMMSITEALAKSASQSRNLARKKLQQLGIDPDQDAVTIAAQYLVNTTPNKNDCDGAAGAATMQQVNGLYYCLEGVAPYTVCVERPDSLAGDPEMVCSDMRFTDVGIDIQLDLDKMMKEEPSILTESARMVASVLPSFNFNSKSFSREINRNNGSPAKAMIAMLKDRSPQVKFSYNLLHAGGPINADSNAFYTVDSGLDLNSLTGSIANDTEIDLATLQEIKNALGGIEGRFNEVYQHNNHTGRTSGFKVPSKESLERFRDLLSAIKSGPYKYALTGQNPDSESGGTLAYLKIQSSIDAVNGFLGHYANPTDSSSWPNGFNPDEVYFRGGNDFKNGMKNARDRAEYFKEHSAAYIIANGGEIGPPPVPVLNADSDYSEAISPAFAAEVVPCSVINRCVNVQAESKRAAELRGKRYLQNVFVE